MNNIKAMYNSRNKISHIIAKYKKMDDVFSFCEKLNVSTITTIAEECGGKCEIVHCDMRNFYILAKEKENNKKTVRLIALDGNIDEYFPNCEIDLLKTGKIRFFIAVEYVEREIHVLIKADQYDHITDEIKIFQKKRG